MRLWLTLSMVLSSLTLLIIMLLMHVQLRRFLQAVPELRDEDDLSKFKKLAAAQMYASLVGLILMHFPLVIWIFGKFIVGHLGWLDLLIFVVAPFLILGLVSGMMIGAATAVRQIDVANTAIGTERDHVVDLWLHRRLPDW
jgi:hypothetical protein